ncbi:hypothetical protein [Chryseobacterium herbae]|uniref:Uncharacterized protein n=1 Tax=Chryseobacterium herbae TaxID=2976476 RepID=A0ABT2IYS8_9FLAO|nr:hypothetical protein [Chryseobacterium sp. pc1-10]MCT2563959.1 hypothetical protein [Chryseobacterium sp. pc1-10]
MTATDYKTALDKFRLKSKIIKELTYNSIVKETTEDQEKRINDLLKPENYTKFFDYYFGVGVSLSLADAPCADFHQSSYEKVFDDPFIIQMRKWFRGSAKSIHTNVGNICHLKENNEIFFGLLIGRNQDFSNLLLSDLQTHLQFNERYIKDFGIQMNYGNWADGEFQTNDGRIFKALGLNQPFRGLRLGANRIDFASIDDCEDRKQAKNQILVQENVEKITGDLGKAFHLRRGRMIVPNNYIVKKGILDGIKEAYKKSKHFDEHIVNIADEKDNPSWHQRYTKKDIKDIKSKTDYHTSQREDYNNPIEKGKRIKAEWIKYKSTNPNKIFSGLIEFWDLSYTKNGNFKAGGIISMANGRAHVLELFNRQCERSDAMDKHYEWQKRYNSLGMSIISYYDATASQKIVYEPEWLIACEDNNAADIPICDHASGDKHDKIDATLTGTFMKGLITFDERLKGTIDMDNTFEHITAFEKGTTSPDDVLDVLEQCVRKGRLLFGYSQKEDSNTRPVIGKNKKRRL